jgi:hypothetical protein
MTFRKILVMLALLAASISAAATIFGSVRGIVHDPQHRPIQNATVTLRAKSSDWAKTTNSDGNGQFEFNAVPIGEYSVSVESSGFVQTAQDVVVASGTQPVVHFQLQVAGKNENITGRGSSIVAAHGAML